MICSIKGCENRSDSRGLCSAHYYHWREYGDPLFTKHHGYSDHPLYRVWAEIKERCYNKDHIQYNDYGGRGITICDEWFDPKVFIEWALPLWKKGLYLDRQGNDGNYCPENCRFVTPKESAHNTRLLRKDNTSGYRGVSFQNRKWIAYININGKRKHLGSFDSPRLAALRYDVEAYLTDDRPRNFF